MAAIKKTNKHGNGTPHKNMLLYLNTIKSMRRYYFWIQPIYIALRKVAGLIQFFFKESREKVFSVASKGLCPNLKIRGAFQN